MKGQRLRSPEVKKLQKLPHIWRICLLTGGRSVRLIYCCSATRWTAAYHVRSRRRQHLLLFNYKTTQTQIFSLTRTKRSELEKGYTATVYIRFIVLVRSASAQQRVYYPSVFPSVALCVRSGSPHSGAQPGV